MLSDLAASLPNYRFTSLYPQALDFVNAVRAYGSSLQAALEKTDAGGARAASADHAAATAHRRRSDPRLAGPAGTEQYRRSQSNPRPGAAEIRFLQLATICQSRPRFQGRRCTMSSAALKVIAAATAMTGAVVAYVPDFVVGEAGCWRLARSCHTVEGGAQCRPGGPDGKESVCQRLAEVSAIGAELAHAIGSWQAPQGEHGRGCGRSPDSDRPGQDSAGGRPACRSRLPSRIKLSIRSRWTTFRNRSTS